MGLTRNRERGIAVLRALMGTLFVWAGVEKILGIGLAAGKTWSAGGYLKFATLGSWPGSTAGDVINPFHDFWVGLASNPQVLSIINILVPWGELGIGVALVLGLGTRFAALMGTLMLGSFYLAGWSFDLGIINSQLVYAFVTAFLGVAAAGQVYGLDRYVERMSIVRRAPQLRYVLG